MTSKFAFVLFLVSAIIHSQDHFEFETNKSKITIPFKLINNLIFIPVKVNGAELNFLLDTGVEETILLSLEDKGDVNFFNVKKIKLKGLGSNEAIEGLKSSGNVMDMNGFIDKHHDLYIVLDENFNFSTHIGIPVNGIIGYHFFKNNLVAIDYAHKKIIIYNDEKKIRKKLTSNFNEIPITIEKNKPYMATEIAIGQNPVNAKLLLDVGNSDALWLFPNEERQITIPAANFQDYLGRGFSGEIHGNRAKISRINFGKFEFNNPIIAFPDSASIKSVNMVKDRTGSVGAEILKRFTVIFDYRNKKMYVKSNSNFSLPFHYNMSGIELQNEGMQWVQETVKLETVVEANTYDINGNKNDFKYKFILKPIYLISNIRPNSAAELCGLQKGDAITKINGFPAYKYSLAEINDILKSEEGKWMTFQVMRNGTELKFKFQLKSIL
ncbi:hypothetical protein FNO01nite_31680 [Flavobacterium noncentrifugens]|uniref:Aspartyl protease n=1 Tax=Flavobacterium noncentrifugens TaxID=1128970 RepID=A0A1G9BLE6_9FLAO|nr:PDZ domain-containing protein [Flavobacterium noncentrifugens]GEP52496.1 hypothetical protein FNO01nite_31680 [Flavobacterium noncentrifugens]SDK40233.1 hypothetical protein SAMN04487935_3269 [Flavobacterium noncentrifugens]